MPSVRVVDIKGESHSISDSLFQRILEVHREGRQSILFLNRRGFGHFFHCRSCGYQMICKRCSVSMIYHKSRGMMLCHYCGYRARPVDVCPECGSLDVGFGGFGTEQIEEELASRLPALRTQRVDTDTVRRKGVLEQVIQDFHDRKIDVLLGTQMVAKGLNFPGVKLVGILMADSGLHIPDFRAAERVFSLIVQVSGRAGRFVPDGEVVVQTLRPKHDTIRLAAGADIEAFYQSELAVRRQLGFPPYARLFRLVFRSRYPDRADTAAASFRAALPDNLTSIARVMGPSECLLSVISGNYRRHLILQTEVFDRAHHILGRVLDAFDVPSGVHLEIDVDPVSLM
jgi:primosomal protein N' (replication factor Y)